MYAVLALLAVCTGLTDTSDSGPVIVVGWLPGGGSHALSLGEFDYAIWEDGKVIWRESPIDRGFKSIDLTSSNYLEGQVQPTDVRTALGKLRGAGLFEKPFWGRAQFDTHLIFGFVRSGLDKTKINCPVDGSPLRLRPESKQICVKYTMVREACAQIKKSTGRIISRPSLKEQASWL